ncbi:MAG: hypothetical protein HOP15_10575, partial [Planctomycetes bacterium]|nr:hypothetical protein [Planctomycetota bacterium]
EEPVNGAAPAGAPLAAEAPGRAQPFAGERRAEGGARERGAAEREGGDARETSRSEAGRESGRGELERGGLDPARAEEVRKRFENMSEEERTKAMEAFRGGRRGGTEGGAGG